MKAKTTKFTPKTAKLSESFDFGANTKPAKGKSSGKFKGKGRGANNRGVPKGQWSGGGSM